MGFGRSGAAGEDQPAAWGGLAGHAWIVHQRFPAPILMDPLHFLQIRSMTLSLKK